MGVLYIWRDRRPRPDGVAILKGDLDVYIAARLKPAIPGEFTIESVAVQLGGAVVLDLE
jgi:hypothetical protein